MFMCLILNLFFEINNCPQFSVLVNDETLYIGSTEFVPQSGNLLDVIPRFNKEFSVELEVKLTAKSPNQWTNLIQITRGNGGMTNPGDRMPLISVRPNSHRIHISACVVSGNTNFNINYPADESGAIAENVWTKIKVEQYLEKGKYFYAIHIDGNELVNVENTTPYILDNMKVQACGDGKCDIAYAAIRNFKVRNISPSKFHCCLNQIQ